MAEVRREEPALGNRNTGGNIGKILLTAAAMLACGLVGAAAWKFLATPVPKVEAKVAIEEPKPTPPPEAAPVVMIPPLEPVAAFTDAAEPALPIAAVPAVETPVATTHVPVVRADPRVVFRMFGSNTIGSKLGPMLMESFLKSKGATNVVLRTGTNAVERRLEMLMPGDSEPTAVVVRAHGS